MWYSLLVAGLAGVWLGRGSGFRAAFGGSSRGGGRLGQAPQPFSPLTRISSSNSGSSGGTQGDSVFAQSFVAQKNFILLDKLERPANGDLAYAAKQYVNFCDESFNLFLNERVAAAESEAQRELLGKVRYEINSARQQKLIEADAILRAILSSGGLKQMEAKLDFHLRRHDVDMAFMVILQLNIEDAINNKVEKAVQIMTHLETLINEYQDEQVPGHVRLMRMLLRTDDSMVRKQMLRQKLVEAASLSPAAQPTAAAAEGAGLGLIEAEAPQSTSVPQCEFIVVAPVQSWGTRNVAVQDLRDTIADVLMQMTASGGEDATIREMEDKCAVLDRELQEVLAELTQPKTNDMCEDDAAAAAVANSIP